MVADLIKVFDCDSGSSMTIDDIEFYKAMRERFGFKGSKYASEPSPPPPA